MIEVPVSGIAAAVRADSDCWTVSLLVFRWWVHASFSLLLLLSGPGPAFSVSLFRRPKRRERAIERARQRIRKRMLPIRIWTSGCFVLIAGGFFFGHEISCAAGIVVISSSQVAICTLGAIVAVCE